MLCLIVHHNPNIDGFCRKMIMMHYIIVSNMRQIHDLISVKSVHHFYLGVDETCFLTA